MALMKIIEGICSDCKEHSSNEYSLNDTEIDDECKDLSDCCGATLCGEGFGYDEDAGKD